MTPHTTGGSRGGNLEVDRQIAGLGKTRSERRLRFSIESTDERKLNRVNAIIDKLIEDDRWETLRAWQRGELTVGDMIDADRKGAASKSLGRVKQHARLWDVSDTELGAVSRALAKVKGGHTRARYVTAFKALQRKGERWLGASATVGDLQTLPWDTLAAEWGASPADWMQLRRAISRFLTLHLGDKYDPFARAIRQLIPTRKVKKRKPKLSIDRFRAIAAAAEKDAPHVAAGLWVLVITGMRVGEYLRCRGEHLDRATYTLEVPGTKTEKSERTLEIDPRWWGWLELGIPSRVQYKALHEHWKGACVAAGAGELRPTGKMKRVRVNAHAGPLRTGEKAQYELVPRTRYHGAWMHDLRHCHGQWAVNAGVEESKIQASYGHEDAGMTRDYVLQHATRDVSSALADAILGTGERRVRRPGRSPGSSAADSGPVRRKRGA